MKSTVKSLASALTANKRQRALEIFDITLNKLLDVGNTMESAEGSGLVRIKTDWRENKKETKLVALRDKKRKKRRPNCSCGPKVSAKFF